MFFMKQILGFYFLRMNSLIYKAKLGNKNMKKNLIRIAVILFVIILVWRIIILIKKGGESSKDFGRPPVAVLVDSVRYGPIQEINMFTGTVYPLYQYIVAPKVSGRIIIMKKRIGDWVRRGEIITRIGDAEYQQSVLEAEANLKIARAALSEAVSQLELSRQEFKRVQSLNEKGIASPSELDAATSNYSAQESRSTLARAQVEQREASLKSAKIRLAYTVLAATEPGFIGERFVDEGNLLAPNSPIVSVIGIDTVIIKTTIIERVYGRIRTGQMAEVEVDAFPAKRFYGKVARIAPMLQETSRVAKIEVDVPNDSLFLKPGMFARLRVILEDKKLAQLIPAEALVSRGGENGIFVIESEEKIARYIPVSPGIKTKEKVEILSPKIENMVVTLGQHLLEDGSPVILSAASNNEQKLKTDKE